MNQLTAIVVSIQTEDHISLVMVEASGILFSTLVIDTPATAPYLRVGNEVNMVFKESAMSIGKNISGQWSMRNRFPATVIAVVSGVVLTSVTLCFKGATLKAVITTQAAQDLALAAGDEVEGLVKTNDISLMCKEL